MISVSEAAEMERDRRHHTQCVRPVMPVTPIELESRMERELTTQIQASIKAINAELLINYKMDGNVTILFNLLPGDDSARKFVLSKFLAAGWSISEGGDEHDIAPTYYFSKSCK